MDCSLHNYLPVLRRRPAATGAVVTLLVSVPEALRACPVCFGASDSPMAAGMNAGIMLLLGVTTAVLGAIGIVGATVVRRSQAAAEDAPSAARRRGDH